MVYPRTLTRPEEPSDLILRSQHHRDLIVVEWEESLSPVEILKCIAFFFFFLGGGGRVNYYLLLCMARRTVEAAVNRRIKLLKCSTF